jgi:hypothetical protein
LDGILRFTVLTLTGLIALNTLNRPEHPMQITVQIPDIPAATVTIEPAIINVTVPEQTLELPAPVINLTVPKSEPSTVIVEPAPVLPPEVIYQDRDVERICGAARSRTEVTCRALRLSAGSIPITAPNLARPE